MPKILPFRPTTLAFPGTLPGFDQAHIASKNVRFVAVPAGKTYIAQTIDQKPSGLSNRNIGDNTYNSSTCSAVIDAFLGPCINFANTTSDQVVFHDTGGSQLGQSTNGNMTVGLFLTSFTGSNFQNLFQPSSAGAAPWIALFNGNVSIRNAFSLDTTLSVGSGPYFFAISFAGTTLNIVLRALNTGKVTTYTTTITALSAFNDGHIFIGNSSNNGNNFNGKIGAVMYSAGSMSMPALRQWAEDPWAFWYPRFDLASLLTVAAAPAAPIALPPFLSAGLFYSDTRYPHISTDVAQVSLSTTDKRLVPTDNLPALPANYFGWVGKAVRLTMFGRITTALTPGNGQVDIYLNDGTDAQLGTIIGSSAAFALTASQTSLSWRLDLIIRCRALGASGSLFVTGKLLLNPGVAANTVQPIMIPASVPAPVTVDLTTAKWISPQFKRSGSTAETMQVHDVLFEALN